MTSPAYKFTIKLSDKQRKSINIKKKLILKVLKWSMLDLAMWLMQQVFEHLNLAQDLESSGSVQATT